jgi:hypothetical protein
VWRRNRDGCVVTVTRLRVGHPKLRVSMMDRGKRVWYYLNVQTGVGQPAWCPVAAEGSFAALKQPAREASYLHHPGQSLKTNGVDLWLAFVTCWGSKIYRWPCVATETNSYSKIYRWHCVATETNSYSKIYRWTCVATETNSYSKIYRWPCVVTETNVMSWVEGKGIGLPPSHTQTDIYRKSKHPPIGI